MSIGLPRLNFFLVIIDFRSCSGLGLSEITPRWGFPWSFRIWKAKLHILIFWYIFIDLKMQIFIKFLKDLYRDKIKKSLKIRICSRMRNIDFWRSNFKSVLFLYAYLKTFSEEVFLKIIKQNFDIFYYFSGFHEFHRFSLIFLWKSL